MVKRSWLNESPSPDSLTIAYLNAWEMEWPERHSYTKDELVIIRSSLFSAVLPRFTKTGEFNFTNAELTIAIQAVKDLQVPAKKSRQNSEINEVCYGYIGIFLRNWPETNEYTEAELNIILTHLYATVLERYESSCCRTLKITKREIKQAQEFVEKRRAKQQKEALHDERDRTIRVLRTKYGTVAESKIVLHK
jgi:hypothetical protein